MKTGAGTASTVFSIALTEQQEAQALHLCLLASPHLGRSCRNGWGDRLFVRQGRGLVMLMPLRGDAVLMCVTSRWGGLHLGGCPAAMVIGSAKRHGRGSSTLRGYCQHQQPNQQRSDQQTHPSTLAQCARPVPTTAVWSPLRR